MKPYFQKYFKTVIHSAGSRFCSIRLPIEGIPLKEIGLHSSGEILWEAFNGNWRLKIEKVDCMLSV